MASTHKLPREVLLQIFSYYLQTETQLDFICKLSHVCQDWRKVCMDISLWRKFDGTLPLCFLKKLMEEGSLKKTEIFTLSYNETPLSLEELQDIYRNLPLLKSINFSKASWMFANFKCILSFSSKIIRYCPNFCEIILQENYSHQPPRLDYNIFDLFLYFRGSNLIILDISNTSIQGTGGIFITIGYLCPNLEEFKARNMHDLQRGNDFPINHIQKYLKKLKVLELGSPIKIKHENFGSSVGFPNLDTFTHPSREDFNFKDFALKELLMNSPNLRVLDIRGCRRITPTSLHNLPAANLEGLYVSRTSAYEYHNFVDILLKWSHSLVALDVSKMRENRINALFSNLFSRGHLKQLEILYLNNTQVTINTVKFIIQKCPKLKFLDLESCRAIGRGRQHIFRGRLEIIELLNLDNDENMDTI